MYMDMGRAWIEHRQSSKLRIEPGNLELLGSSTPCCISVSPCYHQLAYLNGSFDVFQPYAQCSSTHCGYCWVNVWEKMPQHLRLFTVKYQWRKAVGMIPLRNPLSFMRSFERFSGDRRWYVWTVHSCCPLIRLSLSVISSHFPILLLACLFSQLLYNQLDRKLKSNIHQ